MPKTENIAQRYDRLYRCSWETMLRGKDAGFARCHKPAEWMAHDDVNVPRRVCPQHKALIRRRVNATPGHIPVTFSVYSPLCKPCTEFFDRQQRVCTEDLGECDCPGCQGLCKCEDL